MTKRNFVTEILSKNSRDHHRGTRWNLTLRRLDAVSNCFQVLSNPSTLSKEVRAELIKYLPVAMIAVTEAYYKRVYSDLINAGDPYLTNVRNFKEIKLSLEPIIEIQNQTINIGELIAHLLLHNSLNDIEHNMSSLIGGNYRSLLMLESYVPYDSIDPIPMSEMGEAIFSGVQDLYQIRHIICHEFATKHKFSISHILRIAQLGFLFLSVSESCVEGLINPRSA